MSIWKGIRFFLGKFPSFSVIGYKARQSRWSPLRPDFSGQTWLVTGGSDGIGATIAEIAAMRGARVVVVARSREPMEAMKKRVEARLARRARHHEPAPTCGMIIPVTSDLSDLASISALVTQLSKKVRLDVLVNNVGILNDEHKASKQGFELSYSVNIVGHYFLTQSLIEAGIFNRAPLIMTMSSGGLYNQPLNLGLLNQKAEKFDGLMAYASHKRAQIALIDHWRRYYRDQEIFAYTMHPGWVRTKGVQSSLPLFDKVLKRFLRTPAQGADTAIWLAQRRPPTRENIIWFDRKQRSPYMFRDTRKPRTTTSALLRYLNHDVERGLADIRDAQSQPSDQEQSADNASAAPKTAERQTNQSANTPKQPIRAKG